MRTRSTTIAKIAVVLFVVALISMSSCGGDETYYAKDENTLRMGDNAVEYHTFSDYTGMQEIVRVIDTELCVILYITGNGNISQPILMSDLQEGTDTYLELADYCQGRFK